VNRVIAVWLVGVCFLLVGFGHGLTKTTEDPVIVSWTPPTEYTDNSPLPPSDLKHYTVYWACDAVGNGNVVIDHPTISSDLQGQLIGQCSITVTATVITNATSDHSDSVSVLVRLPKPSYGGFR
jgi:hypothetical protein